MTIPGNPKLFARDIANGFFVFNQATCRQFTPVELRSICRLLEQVARDIRAEQIPLEANLEIQKKNLRLSRATNSLLFIRNHARRLGIVL